MSAHSRRSGRPRAAAKSDAYNYEGAESEDGEGVQRGARLGAARSVKSGARRGVGETDAPDADDDLVTNTGNPDAVIPGSSGMTEAQFAALSSDEQKKQRRLIRNRLSAQLHRERQRNHIVLLETQVTELTALVDAYRDTLTAVFNDANSALASGLVAGPIGDPLRRIRSSIPQVLLHVQGAGHRRGGPGSLGYTGMSAEAVAETSQRVRQLVQSGAAQVGGGAAGGSSAATAADALPLRELVGLTGILVLSGHEAEYSSLLASAGKCGASSSEKAARGERQQARFGTAVGVGGESSGPGLAQPAPSEVGPESFAENVDRRQGPREKRAAGRPPRRVGGRPAAAAPRWSVDAGEYTSTADAQADADVEWDGSMAAASGLRALDDRDAAANIDSRGHPFYRGSGPSGADDPASPASRKAETAAAPRSAASGNAPDSNDEYGDEGAISTAARTAEWHGLHTHQRAGGEEVGVAAQQPPAAKRPRHAAPVSMASDAMAQLAAVDKLADTSRASYPADTARAASAAFSALLPPALHPSASYPGPDAPAASEHVDAAVPLNQALHGPARAAHATVDSAPGSVGLARLPSFPLRSAGSFDTLLMAIPAGGSEAPITAATGQGAEGVAAPARAHSFARVVPAPAQAGASPAAAAYAADPSALPPQQGHISAHNSVAPANAPALMSQPSFPLLPRGFSYAPVAAGGPTTAAAADTARVRQTAGGVKGAPSGGATSGHLQAFPGAFRIPSLDLLASSAAALSTVPTRVTGAVRPASEELAGPGVPAAAHPAGLVPEQPLRASDDRQKIAAKPLPSFGLKRQFTMGAL
jgi:hypothetical protein